MRLLNYTLFIINFALAACALSAQTASTTVSFQNGVAGYSGAFEVGIEKGKGKLSATSLNLWVGREGERLNNIPKRESQALVRFDGIFGTKPSQIPPGASIIKATLRLCVGTKKDATSYHRIFLNRMLVPWDANASWKNPKWGDDGIKANGTDAVPEPDALFIPNRNNTAYDIDVTKSLRAWAAGEPNHGWVLLSTRSQYVPAAFITSRLTDAGRRPMLTVSYDPQPGNKAPEIKDLSATPSGASSVTLSLKADDDGKKPLNVTFYGRKRVKAGPDFEVVLIPDTQHYCSKKHGGTPEMFASQIDWLLKNHKERGIAFALHLGDITDTGDVYESEWEVAISNLYRLEDPKTTGLPHGIPYLVNVGNHDQRERGADGKIRGNGPANFYNKYFGVEHFKDKGYYGGNFGSNNNNYYALFEGGAEKFIAISLEYDYRKRNPDVLAWAEGLLKKHSDRHGIVITHAAMLPGVPGAFLPDGQNAYDALKDCPNLMLMACGHTAGEGRRTEKHKNSVVHSIIKDFQQDDPGGNGWLGILAFSPSENKIRVQTYSPYLNQWRTDEYASYTLDYDFGAKIDPFVKIATVKSTPGGTVTCRWANLATSTDYEWYAEVNDGQKTTRTETTLLNR